MKAEFTAIIEPCHKLYSIFNDGTISTIADVAQICFHREALSLKEAIRSAIMDVKSAGFDVVRIEIEPERMLQKL